MIPPRRSDDGETQADDPVPSRDGELQPAQEPTLKMPCPHEGAIEQTGTRVGRYELLHEIGQGGFGRVYLAEQREPIRRRVALKIIKAGMDTREVIARFEAERQALALMDHPHIARVLDAGATESGRPYFVMELVRGVPITAYCDEHNLNTKERLNLFITVCQAVQHAHQKGIIHRDLKPANVLVATVDGQPVPKVIDFGIAKAMGPQLTEKTIFTRLEQMVGTPAYMSPEQTALSGVDVDTRADIYSLGVLLYEMLTGTTPVDQETLRRAAYEEIRRIIRELDPPKPSTRLQSLGEKIVAVASHRQSEPATLARSVSGDLDWITMKCLEKDRARRYETANELVQDLRRFLDHEPVLACPPSRLYRLRKMVGRNKVAFAVVGAVAASLMLGLGLSTWLFLQERRARHAAVTAEQEQTRLRGEAESARQREAGLRQEAQVQQRTAQAEAAKSKQTADFLAAMLRGVGPSVALGRDTSMLRDILDRTSEDMGRKLKGQPEVEAQLRSTIALVYRDLGDYAKAETLIRDALALRKEYLGQEHATVADSLADLAEVLRLRVRPAEAEPYAREALALRRKLLGAEHIASADSLGALGRILHDQRKLPEAEATHREAVAAMRKLPIGGDPAVAAPFINNLAVAVFERGGLAEAEDLFREALSLWRELPDGPSPGTADAVDGLAGVLVEGGRPEEAESLLRESLAMKRKVLGDHHPGTATSLGNLAIALLRQGKLAEAEGACREALTIQRERLGRGHGSTAVTLHTLGAVLKASGQLAEAENTFREALAIQRELAAEGSPIKANVLWGLFAAVGAQGKWEEAESLGREILALERKTTEQDEGEWATFLDMFADVLTLRGKSAEAQVVRQRSPRGKGAGEGSPLLLWNAGTNCAVVFDEPFQDHPQSRFHVLPVPTAGSISSFGTTDYRKAEHAFAISGYLSVVRPVRAGPHVLLDLDLVFEPPPSNAPPVAKSAFQFVLFNRSTAGIEFRRPLQAGAPPTVAFTLDRDGQKEGPAIREVTLRDAPASGPWRVSFRHGLLTLHQSTNLVGCADTGTLGIQVAGVTWVQRGGVLACRRMTLRGEPFRQRSSADAQALQQAAALNEQAQQLFNENAPGAALAKMREASALFLKVNGEHDPDFANSLVNLAMIHQARKEFEEAGPLWIRALAIHEETLGPLHPRTTLTRFHYAECCEATGKKKQARDLWLRCHDDWQAVLGPDYAPLQSLKRKLQEPE